MSDTCWDSLKDTAGVLCSVAAEELESIVGFLFSDSGIRRKTDISAFETFDLMTAVYTAKHGE